MKADEELLDILEARRGLVCAVGAGGKKSTLYRLANTHPGRVGITATVHVPTFPRALDAVRVVAARAELPARVAAAAAGAPRVAFAQPSAKVDRFAGLDPAVVERIHADAGFDVCYVKADGARFRLIKAPAGDEPRLPRGAATVIPVVSARVFGKALSERVAHRPERLCELCGMRPGDPVTPEHVACLLAHGDGALRHSGGAVVVPLINMVDGPAYRAPAHRAAEIALELTDRFDRVVLGSMRSARPVVEVVRR